MRLLKVEGYKLVEANDIPTPFPRYATLSHTWNSPKDEITYQDLKHRKQEIEDNIFKQIGWAKLRQFCDRAAKDGFEWAWMDTCCIDKDNPADTQAAISAMFRWYQKAGICYAYLDDVVGNDNVVHPTSCPSPAPRTFISAKWFTRSWTVQELLAPPCLIFLDQAWRRIGTREDLANEIKEASRIEARYLTNFNPTDFKSCSIATRLSWASRRLTTVEEDETYSLLGLFGISMPLIYGEGRWQAFNRLQRKLISTYHDDSIFAWRLGPSMNERFIESQETANEHGGILAPSIKEYWDVSNVTTSGFCGNEFSMTNRGLEIKAKRWRRKDDPLMYLIRLSCGRRADNDLEPHHLVIPLKRVDDAYDRVRLRQIYDMSTIRLDEWQEEFSQEPTVIRANNY